MMRDNTLYSLIQQRDLFTMLTKKNQNYYMVGHNIPYLTLPEIGCQEERKNFNLIPIDRNSSIFTGK
jgi:hypothetical protein